MISREALEELGFDFFQDFELELVEGEVIISKWYSDKPQPSNSDISIAHDLWEASHKSCEYIRKRKAEYPSIEECIHAILDNDLDSLQEKRQAVKNKYPKPE